ncbi:replication restart DNA helicase PriA [Desulfotomaculum arcticum]|uniref:Replication restart protein PriA n=1 Tax=Desulfotruncus arcticus DSM 17038 TaxID=1121424 RepID=A0A1I2R963_9FIRM|nr:primosomal protein N' [Desulfotruncus arcticus]SFG36593.1 replication restart DNA helicase PriA [Desulfotomaculum arcticum] [Desulfotruncus arcticus DSM 17038]
MTDQLFADVLVDVPVPETGRTFQYLVPREIQPLLHFGHRVQVPFGGRKVTGYVVGLSHFKAVDKIKEISKLVDEKPLFREDQYALARWMAEYYLCDTVKSLQAVIAPVLKKTSARLITRYYCSVDSSKLPGLREELGRRAPKSLAALEKALLSPGLTRAGLAAAAGVSTAVVDRLCAKGLLKAKDQVSFRDPYPQAEMDVSKRVELNVLQQKAVGEINNSIAGRRHQVFLLHGITGSGKTEVYLHCIEQVLREGRQAVTLVPEISLTPQMVKQFRSRFGREVAVLHSRMSDGERFDEWVRIERGEAPVVLGARSAVLAPVRDPGLIIVDEEHEWSYKQEETPRYHARAVALYRAQKSSGVVVLGSATPSLESYCRATPDGVYRLISMDKRVEGRGLPRVGLVDMREEARAGNGGIFSRLLIAELQKRIAAGEQAIIFLNRRGMNTLAVCRECGLVLKCPRCDISLTYHTEGRLRCHYCNYSMRAPKLCPDCGDSQISYFGTGTQRVEKELRAAIPGARVLRMDADTTTRKGSHQQILEEFESGAADILVGTQMIAKGLDISGVTLVGVVNADITLHMPDFRAGERTFQLLAQVAGRTGRGDKPGDVLIQTYTPEHYSVQAAARHDYPAFFEKEMLLRKTAGYPPFSKMARVLVTGPEEGAVKTAAERLRVMLDEFAQGQDGGRIYLVGPAPAPLARLKNTCRWHIITWSQDYGQLHRMLKKFRRAGGCAPPGKGLHVSLDIDPFNLM